MSFVTLGEERIEYKRVAAGSRTGPVIVMLHEGLGSVAMWKDFPEQVAKVTGCDVVAYSRAGYGASSPLTRKRTVEYMHDEALLLPELLEALQIEKPILLGHSDGASIALIHAGSQPEAVSALILLAPHVIVEDITVESIAQAKVAYETTDLRDRLRRYHEHVDSAFWGWNEIWLDVEFRQWNITEYLPRIICPILAIQGWDDQYGTMTQLELIASASPQVKLLQLEQCRHSPHRDQPEAVLKATGEFVQSIVTGTAGLEVSSA